MALLFSWMKKVDVNVAMGSSAGSYRWETVTVFRVIVVCEAIPLNRVANRAHWELTASDGPAPAPQTCERRGSLIQLTCLCKASVRCCTVYTALYSVLYCQTQPRIHYASLHNTRTVLINKLTRYGSKNGIAYWTKQFAVPCNLYLFVLTSFNLTCNVCLYVLVKTCSCLVENAWLAN